ncbi:ribonuclease H-like domain-containing protein [Tanacetum coccineum]|uniref:Ribonuclease H-like domain-containing protein n=1 Tax=Tanacetum coccineum TaxID=301880 RepID=A0ABQ5I7W8_9ASTR
MDLVTKLPKSSDGYDVIWVIMDRLTKSAHFLPIRKDYKTKKLTRIYINEIVARHGVPIGRKLAYWARNLQEMTEKIIQIKERLKMAKSHQKSSADKRRKPLEFKVGERLLLKVSPWKGVKCLVESDVQVPLEEIEIDENLRLVEEPIEIVEQDVKKLKRRRIPLIKVRWNSRLGPEFTWEREDQFQRKYPHLFSKPVPSVKKSVGASSGAQNLAFMTTPSTSSTNDVNTASLSDNAVNRFEVEALSAKYEGKEVLSEDRQENFHYANDTAGYDKSKVECFNCHKMGHFARSVGNRNKEGSSGNQDTIRKQETMKDHLQRQCWLIDGCKVLTGVIWAKEQVSDKHGFMHFQTLKAQAVNTARPKAVKTARPNSAVVNAVRVNQANAGKPQQDDTGFVDSGCSRHMTGNIAYLLDFKEFDRGYVTFGGGAHGGRISGKGTLKTDSLDFEDVYFVNELKFNLFSVSQMCDKKNYVLFTDTECLVLSPNFKLPDESQILLKIPRKDNMYSFDMKNIVPKESLTCLVAKATSDESML